MKQKLQSYSNTSWHGGWVPNRVESATEGRKQRPCPPAACLWQQQRHTAGRRLSQWRASELLPPPTLCSPSTVRSTCPGFTWTSVQVESRKSQLTGEVIVGGKLLHEFAMFGHWPQPCDRRAVVLSVVSQYTAGRHSTRHSRQGRGAAEVT